jgi:hypothetical protein
MVDPPGLVPHSLTRSLTPAAPHSSSGPGSFVFLALERKSLDHGFVAEALPQPVDCLSASALRRCANADRRLELGYRLREF